MSTRPTDHICRTPTEARATARRLNEETRRRAELTEQQHYARLAEIERQTLAARAFAVRPPRTPANRLPVGRIAPGEFWQQRAARTMERAR